MRVNTNVILLLLILGSFFIASANAQSDYYSSFKTITIDHTKVAGDLTNFPVLISLVNDTAVGGKAQPNGNDIFFTSSDGSPLAYERESFTISMVNGNNSCNASIWVKVPYISSTSDTVIKLYYGNQTASDTQNKSAVWDDGGSGNFLMVQHMNQDPSVTAPQISDSTTYHNDGTALGSMTSGNSVSGEISKAISFNGNGNYIQINQVTPSLSTFSKSSNNPMITGSFASVWYDGGIYHAYYGYGTGIYHATSSDGKNWTPDNSNNPVLTTTPRSWDSGILEVPYVWKENSTWYMLYRGSNGINTEKHIGLATSSNGLTWVKSSYNPVMNATAGTWEVSDGYGLDPWGVIKIGSTYYLWFNTVNTVYSGSRATGLATSTDLIHWTRDPNNPIFTNGQYCIQPFKYGSYYYMLVPQYNGKIKLYCDSKPTFYQNERTFLGTILESTPGTWDGFYLDTPYVLTNNIQRDSFPDPNTLWMYYTGYNQNTATWQEGLATTPFTNLFAPSPAISNAVTLEDWVNIDSASPTYSLIFHKNNAFGLGLNKISSVFYPIMELKTNLSWRFTSDGNIGITAGNWHHVAATYDSSSHTVNYYVDGQPAGSDMANANGPISSSSDNLLINYPSVTYGTPGTFDEMRISNLVRSPGWIKTEYNNQYSPSTFYAFGPDTANNVNLPVANFTSNVTNGSAPLNVQFTDSSLNANWWNWNFGDGTNISGNDSSTRNPMHTFVAAGIYTVNLTVSNANVTNSKLATISVGLIPNFTSNVTSGPIPLTVQFTDMSIGSTSWNWDFGDGASSTQQSPVNTYYNAGNYTVNHTVSDGHGSNSKLGTIIAIPPFSVANFTSNVTSGTSPLVVQFTDLSTNATWWNWDFGDGTNVSGNDSSARSPVHTYSTAGNYIVNLTVSNGYGNNSKLGTISVNSSVLPVANFSSVTQNYTVNFTDLSTNVTGWYWEFGDGASSTQQNPSHTYVSNGTYIVSLKASNAYGNDTTTRNVTVPSVLYSDFPNTKVLTLSSNPGIGYQIPVPVSWENSATLPMNTSFADLRFDDGVNKLNYWIVPDSLVSGSSCTVYVKLASTSTTLYEHWGNPTASSVSNIGNTMELGDEFSGSSLNSSLWTGNADLSGGTATIPQSYSIYSRSTFGRGYEIISRTKMSYSGSSDGGIGFLSSTNGVLMDAYTGNGYFQLYTRSAGASSGSLSSVPIDTNWHNVRVYYSATPSMVIDNTTISKSTNVPSVSLPVYAASYITGSFVVDYVAVRKYSGADPTVSFGSSLSAAATSELAPLADTIGPILPSSNFTSNVTSGTVPLTVQFTDLSTGSPTVWNWDFGDGTNSTLQSPVHTYVAAGNYTVNLTVNNTNGSNSKLAKINVSVAQIGQTVVPFANFSSNVTSGVAPFDVQFNDSSLNATAWNWDFGDGTNNSLDKNPTHTYSSSGDYIVNLTVKNANGTSSKTAPITVLQPILPRANFTSNVTSGVAPLDVQFNDSSLNASWWNWDFGDETNVSGNNSSTRNPMHSYPITGNYTVNLTVSNANGINSKLATINVSGT